MKKKAVAIQYDKSLPAPIVLAKGQGQLAEKILDLAQKSGITVLPQEELVERLLVLETGSLIPEDCFALVAELLLFVNKLKNEGARGAV